MVHKGSTGGCGGGATRGVTQGVQMGSTRDPQGGVEGVQPEGVNGGSTGRGAGVVVGCAGGRCPMTACV